MTLRNRLFARFILPICAAILLTSAWIANAGDLNPPIGPVAPTHKTLTEVEPRIAVNAVNTPGSPTAVFVISQPGSYYLMGNVTGISGKSGIEVASSNVTLDLRGFALISAYEGVSAITVSTPVTNCAIRDGQISGWTNWGIDAYDARNCRIDRVSVSDCANGILTGNNAVVRDCVLFDTGADGLWVGAGSVVSGCASTLNDESGIVLEDGCTLTDSTCWHNGEHGIRAGNQAQISHCNVSFNIEGGINALANSLILDSVISSNGGSGIFISSGIVQGCTVNENGYDGIITYGAATIAGNICTGNGHTASIPVAGIVASGSGSRIEANTVCNNDDAGIRVLSGGNLVIRNATSGNTTNYDISAGNTVGPIVNSGNISTSSNPHSNYEY